MGKTPKPLTILLTDEDMLEWPDFAKMREQGHTIALAGAFDIVMGSRAHFLTKGMEKLVPVAVKAARARKYGKGGE